MGYEYEIDVERGLLVYRRYGRIEPGELSHSTDELIADEDFSKVDKIFVDLEDADFSAVPYNELVSYGEFSRENLRGGAIRMAMLAPVDLAFGIARVYGSFAAEADNVRAFRDKKSALEWLGIDEAEKRN